MSSEEQNASKTFKFVDKRRFNMDGDLREGAELVDDKPSAPSSSQAASTMDAKAPLQPDGNAETTPTQDTASTPKSSPGDTNRPADGEASDDEMPFLLFVQSLAQQAFMQMGLIPYPDGSQQLALEQARQTIDILSMLQKKTAGNLTDEEAELFQKALYELRMVYLEIVNKAGQPDPAVGGPS